MSPLAEVVFYLGLSLVGLFLLLMTILFVTRIFFHGKYGDPYGQLRHQKEVTERRRRRGLK